MESTKLPTRSTLVNDSCLIVTIAFDETDDVDVDVCAGDDFDNNDEDEDEANDDDDAVDVEEFCVKFVPAICVLILIPVAICDVGVCSCCGMLLLPILSPLSPPPLLALLLPLSITRVKRISDIETDRRVGELLLSRIGNRWMFCCSFLWYFVFVVI